MAKSLTLAKLKRFVGIRNRSEFASNMQFCSDADGAGFSVADLGEVTKHDNGCYSWQVLGATLVENPRFGCGRMAIFVGDEMVFGDSRVELPVAPTVEEHNDEQARDIEAATGRVSS